MLHRVFFIPRHPKTPRPQGGDGGDVDVFEEELSKGMMFLFQNIIHNIEISIIYNVLYSIIYN